MDLILKVQILPEFRRVLLIRHTKNIGKGPALGSALIRNMVLALLTPLQLMQTVSTIRKILKIWPECFENEPNVLWVGAREMGCENMLSGRE
ncbi:hypothetical protein MASR1M46_17960 [Bacteroidales bacterium]